MNNTNKLCLAVYCVALMAFSFCSCAHKSGHHPRPVDCVQTNRTSHNAPNEVREKKISEHTIVKMRKENGVYLVPITVNGLNLDFIFDTGASNISISSAESTVMLRQGKITRDDIMGEQKFQDATGGISVGMIVRLKKVEIGGIVLHDVEASVVDNINAPLLLGQTALAKFGKVTIDYEHETIEFN